MKKSIFITLLMIFICQSSIYAKNAEVAQKEAKYTIEQLFKEFSKEKNVTQVKLGGFAMSFANIFADTKGVSGVEVYSFDECADNVKNNINTAIKNLDDSSYDTLVSTNEKGERTKVLVKIEKDFIKEIVVLAGGDDPALIRIKGKIKPEDVKKIVENNQ